MIWVRKIKRDGAYVDSNGERWGVDWCVKLVTPNGTTEAEHGYEQHDSVESACEEWGLEPYISPEDLAMAEAMKRK